MEATQGAAVIHHCMNPEYSAAAWKRTLPRWRETLLGAAQKHGARVALFGRKINHSEHPLAFIEFLRRIVDGEVAPVEAVKAYHAVLEKLGVKPHRRLTQDLQLTTTALSYRR